MKITRGRIAKLIIVTLVITIISASYMVYARAVSDKDDKKKTEVVNVTKSVKETSKPLELKPSTIKYNDRQALVFDLAYSNIKSNTVISPLAFEMQLVLNSTSKLQDSIETYTGESIEKTLSDYNKLKIDELPTIIIDGNVGVEEVEVSLDEKGEPIITEDSNKDKDVESKININNNVIVTDEIRDVISENIEADKEYDSTAINDVINEFIVGEQESSITSIYELSKQIRFSTKSTDTFYRFGNKNKEVTMLNSTERYFLENEFATGFMKPLNTDSKTYFIGILPKRSGSFDILDLDLASLINSKKAMKVKVGIPEFYVNNTFDLTDSILILGVPEWFSTDDIVSVKQNIKVDINGQGVTLREQSKLDNPTDEDYVEDSENKQVYLNRPFAFAIYDSDIDKYILLGKITNPNKNPELSDIVEDNTEEIEEDEEN